MDEGGVIVGGKYRILHKIGSGSFGTVYLGTNQATGEQVAVKVESQASDPQQLLYEARILKELQGGLGLPVLHWSGTVSGYNVMVQEMLGPSLEDLFTQSRRKFCLKTTCQLAGQLLKRMEFIHEQSIVHRDIKPENFLVGREAKKSSIVFVIDFGLAKKYRDVKTHQHIPYREGKSLTGTARYASINSHLGLELSRRDDLESIAYMLIYFSKGCLPWQGTRDLTKQEKYSRILERKMNISASLLCKGCPELLSKFLTYCKGLRFEEKPDYVHWGKMFVELGIEQGFTFDRVFEWTESTVDFHSAICTKSVSSANPPCRVKSSGNMRSRRKSEYISKATLNELVAKKTLSDIASSSSSHSESSAGTLVYAKGGPCLSDQTRLFLTSLQPVATVSERAKKAECALL